MALTESDLSELLAALKAGEMTDTIRTSLEWILQQLIEAEATAFIGAAPHERTDTRTNLRNGHRPRLLSTPAGDVELEIPKLRQGSFFPSLLERRRRIDRALFAVVMEAYVHGVSTRKVDDLVKALGVGSGISKSEVSRICAELDRDLKAFRDRPLDHTEFVYVFLDATYVKGRVRGRVVSRAAGPPDGVAPPRPEVSQPVRFANAGITLKPRSAGRLPAGALGAAADRIEDLLPVDRHGFDCRSPRLRLELAGPQATLREGRRLAMT